MSFGINRSLGLQLSRHLRSWEQEIAKSLQRISTGNRYASFRENIAAQSQAVHLDAKLRGLQQASLNVTQARGITQLAGASLQDLRGVLVDLEALAQEAAGEITTERREQIQTEQTQLMDFYSNVLSNAQFGGKNFLTQVQSLSVQTGPKANHQFSFSIGSANASSIGSFSQYTSVLGAIKSPLTSLDGIKVNGVSVHTPDDDGVSFLGGAYSAIALANQINSVSSQSGVSAEALQTDRFLAISKGAFDGGAQAYDLEGQDFQLNGIAIEGIVSSAEEFLEAINDKSAETGIVAEYISENDDAVTIQLTAADGRNVVASLGSVRAPDGGPSPEVYSLFIRNGSESASSFLVNLSDEGLFSGASTLSLGAEVINVGQIQLSSTASFTIDGDSLEKLGFEAGTYDTLPAKNLSTLSFATAEDSSLALLSIQSSLKSIDSLISQVGFTDARLERTTDSIERQSITLEDHKERAFGVDVAEEVLKMTEAQLRMETTAALYSQITAAQADFSRLLLQQLFRKP